MNRTLPKPVSQAAFPRTKGRTAGQDHGSGRDRLCGLVSFRPNKPVGWRSGWQKLLLSDDSSA